MPSSPTPIIELVDRLLSAGCAMWALGNRYLIEEPDGDAARSRVQAILRDYGPRDADGRAIAAYLRHLGLYLDDSG